MAVLPTPVGGDVWGQYLNDAIESMSGTGTHASRPAANTVPEGAIWSCTDHNLIYRSDGAAWALFGRLLGDDRRLFPGSGETSVDEFTDGTISGSFTRVDGANAPIINVTWTETGGQLTAVSRIADTGNASHGLMIPLTSVGGSLATGDAFITRLELFGKPNHSTQSVGLTFSDGITYGTGKQITAEAFFANYGPFLIQQVFKQVNWTSDSGTVVVGEGYWAPVPTYLRLVYLGSSNFRMDRSGDGYNWIPGTITNYVITPTHVGFTIRQPASSGGPFHGNFDFLRRVSGVT